MANNDKLLQIISNIQILNDLAKSMLDAEMYPVSFFSQACDLMQKIQRDLNTIEAEQVEMFAAQLKKHQALIFSIHQQMRTISTQPQTPVKPVNVPPLPPPQEKVESVPPPLPPQEKVESVPPPLPPQEKVESVPPPLPPQEKVESVPPPDKVVSQPGTALPDAPPSLNDFMEKKKISDLRRAFSLNDRFRYRKELFGGNEENMNKVITILNSKKTLNESMEFLDQKLHWDFNNPVVKDFVKILETRFL